MSESQTILVVDDDKSIVELLKDFLENDGFDVQIANDADQALAVFQQSTIDCMILDIMMPGQNGFDLCRQIRIKSSVPILFLSARSDDVDKIRGLVLGGDDYIVKTASPGEIVARVRAVLRRSGSQREHNRKILDYGRLTLDITTREVFVEGKKISLTPKEYELLRLFAEHPRYVFTYDQLLEKFWDGFGDKHIIRVHLSRLREKIEENPNQPQYLINEWGVGYRFEGGKNANTPHS
ncbi:DNA-binding response regulator, OmpR family, contains REC and winged-helix (wHTH) domain [Seinonella peptonophila]|uniref:DNA-binding response regulator, OmpR family, contains REC and winged-helix (WHTH) domain n=1 Tax=Seinonella peptonophila TaxID=112248 RepID=A0A1M4Y706_9BACL|nr:response regulator transcription factor [Seinonella peptonophila]SHF01406.1 DNA-binding response regulator, OmpR family, contains REC and winged-helix (wHTH) domain [Seinonella peptonophila]